MFSFDTIDVAIGLALLFLMMSLLCTSLREAVEGVMKTRASDLERGVRQIFQEDGVLTERFYQHPLVYSLFAGDYQRPNSKALIARGGKLPSYIPANQFARALMDMVHQGSAAYSPYGGVTPPLTMVSLREAAAQFPNPQVRRAVLFAIDQARGDLDAARRNLESWFDGTMDRVSGWYKRRTQLILFLIGLTLAVVLNVDAVTIAQRLQSNKVLRDALVEKAQVTIRSSGPSGAIGARPEELAALIESYGLPIGWRKGRPAAQMEARACSAPTPGCVGGRVEVLTPGAVIQMLIGWLITAAAMMLGAPFWFDTLNRLMVIRSTVKPTEKSPEEGSEDRPKARRPADTQGDNAGPRAPHASLPEAAAGRPTPGHSSAATPGGFPFVPNNWADGVEEGVA